VNYMGHVPVFTKPLQDHVWKREGLYAGVGENSPQLVSGNQEPLALDRPRINWGRYFPPVSS